MFKREVGPKAANTDVPTYYLTDSALTDHTTVGRGQIHRTGLTVNRQNHGSKMMVLMEPFMGDIPENAIPGPDKNSWVTVLDSESNAAFGFAIRTDDGIIGYWPWSGDEVHRDNEFSFLVRADGYRYRWLPVSRYLDNPTRFRAYTVEGISPASFAGRLGKICLETMEGWIGWDGDEISKDREDVENAMVLCARKVKQRRDVGEGENTYDFHLSQEGDDPCHNAIQAPDQFNSYVVLTDELPEDDEPGTWGRASCNLHRNGLQAWFPWGDDENSFGDFKVLQHGDDIRVYWARIRNVQRHPEKHMLVTKGELAPVVVNNILGKGRIFKNKAWYSHDGAEHFEDNIGEGKVLCYRLKRREQSSSSDSWSDSD